MEKVTTWFTDRDSFDTSDSRLRSLSTVIVTSADDNVTCDKAEDIGLLIMKGMDEATYTEVKLKKSMQAKLLSDIAGRVAALDKDCQ